ncbi:MAG: ATP-binding protein [Vulcanimicrobiota bacterium]
MQTEEELRHFVHYASHDLQEPLRAVSGYSRLLSHHLGEQADSTTRRLIEQIVGGANRMSSLLKDLLDFSTLGEIGWQVQRVNSAEQLTRARSDLSQEIRDAQAVIERDELPWINADPLALRLLFRALLSNAIKFRRGSHPRIHIGYRADVFRVRDDGIGIASPYHKEVFEPFRRLHTLDEHPGHGLGLALARRIVERHGGKIWIESNPTFGVTVFFYLEANRGHDD